MKKLILVLSVLLICGCDLIVYRVKVNGSKYYTIDSQCGEIRFSCKGNMGSRYYLKIEPIDKLLKFKSDGLIAIMKQINPNIFDIQFFKKRKDGPILDEISIKPGEKLILQFIAFPPFEDGDAPFTQLVIPPGDYLKCDSKNLITDTLRIEFR